MGTKTVFVIQMKSSDNTRWIDWLDPCGELDWAIEKIKRSRELHPKSSLRLLKRTIQMEQEEIMVQ